MNDFYQQLYSRNLGILSETEQQLFKKRVVAVAGCGCIGALSAELLVRAGLENIKIADPDFFEISNINRQITATSSTIGKNKAIILAERLKDINPNLNAEVHDRKINHENAEQFVQEVDLVIDGIDFYEVLDMIALHKAAEHKKVPVITAVSIAFGGNCFAFDENSLSFEEYIEYDDSPDFMLPIDKYCPVLPKGATDNLIKQIIKREVPIPSISVGQAIACGIVAGQAIQYLAKGQRLVTVPNYVSFNGEDNHD